MKYRVMKKNELGEVRELSVLELPDGVPLDLSKEQAQEIVNMLHRDYYGSTSSYFVREVDDEAREV